MTNLKMLLTQREVISSKKERNQVTGIPVEKNSMEQKIAAKKVKTFVNVDVNSKSPSLSFLKLPPST